MIKTSVRVIHCIELIYAEKYEKHNKYARVNKSSCKRGGRVSSIKTILIATSKTLHQIFIH